MKMTCLSHTVPGLGPGSRLPASNSSALATTVHSLRVPRLLLQLLGNLARLDYRSPAFSALLPNTVQREGQGEGWAVGVV